MSNVTHYSLELAYNSTAADGIAIRVAYDNEADPAIVVEPRHKVVQISNLLPDSKYEVTLVPTYGDKQGTPVTQIFWTQAADRTTSTLLPTTSTTTTETSEIIDDSTYSSISNAENMSEDEDLIIEDNLNNNTIDITSSNDKPQETNIITEGNTKEHTIDSDTGVPDDTEVVVSLPKSTHTPTTSKTVTETAHIEEIMVTLNERDRTDEPDGVISIELLNDINWNEVCSSPKASHLKELSTFCAAYREHTTLKPQIDNQRTRQERSSPVSIIGAPLPGQSQGYL